MKLLASLRLSVCQFVRLFVQYFRLFIKVNQICTVATATSPHSQYNELFSHAARCRGATGFFLNFYRATRMHSADYVVARCPSVCLYVVCPSVRLTHVGIEYERLYISSKFFQPSGSTTILVFPHQTGAPNAGGMEKITIFRPISRFIWQMMQDRAIVTMEGE